MINTANDEVEIFKSGDEYRWRRVDGDNGKILFVSSEGYTKKAYCEEAAEAYNPGLTVYYVDR